MGLLFRGRRHWGWVAMLAMLAGYPAVGAEPAGVGPLHPLEPLSKEELAKALRILAAEPEVGPGDRFPMVALQEPGKEEIREFRAGDAVPRRAVAVVYDRVGNRTREAVVDLGEEKVVAWKNVPGAHPNYHGEDFRVMEGVVRSDARWREAIRKRGISNPDDVMLDLWGPGSDLKPEERPGRTVRVICFERGGAGNPYARPIEGLVLSVDVRSKKILEIQDKAGPRVRGTAEFDAKSVGPLRQAPKPLKVSQPEGVSFEVDGHSVKWQNWRFRFALHPREGLVLHTVGYEEKGEVRSVLYRASLAEMIVPYGDPSRTWSFRNAFDEGEFGIGTYADSLVAGVDCPTNARYFDAAFAGDDGQIVHEIPRAIGLFERDGGVLWKHAGHVGPNETRRARELVLTSYTTLGNYTYGFEWVFRQDGSLEMGIVHTGIMLVKGQKFGPGMHEAEPLQYGHAVADSLVAVHHQHIFNFRLDLDVDGPVNSVMELSSEALAEDAENPVGNAFVMNAMMIRSEREGRRQMDQARSRKWSVINRGVKNALGHPVGYLLVPGENSAAYLSERSPARRRAGFVGAHLWVTQFDPAQRYAAGDYPTLREVDDGLPRWIQADRGLDDQDVVLWYTLGVTHTPRPEEWPVMPTRRVGFVLLPSGFFARNPALDVPNTP